MFKYAEILEKADPDIPWYQGFMGGANEETGNPVPTNLGMTPEQTMETAKASAEATKDMLNPPRVFNDFTAFTNKAIEKAPGGGFRILGGMADLGRSAINWAYNNFMGGDQRKTWLDQMRKAHGQPPRQPWQYQDIMAMDRKNPLTVAGEKVNAHPLTRASTNLAQMLNPLTFVNTFNPRNPSTENEFMWRFPDTAFEPSYSKELQEAPGSNEIMGMLEDAPGEALWSAGMDKLVRSYNAARAKAAIRQKAIEEVKRHAPIQGKSDWIKEHPESLPIEYDKGMVDAAKSAYEPTLWERIWPGARQKKLKELSTRQGAEKYLRDNLVDWSNEYDNENLLEALRYGLGESRRYRMNRNVARYPMAKTYVSEYDDVLRGADKLVHMANRGRVGYLRDRLKDGAKIYNFGDVWDSFDGEPTLVKGWNKSYSDLDDAMLHGSMSGTPDAPNTPKWFTPVPEVAGSYGTPGGSIALIQQPKDMQELIQGAYTPHIGKFTELVDMPRMRQLNPQIYEQPAFGLHTPGLSKSKTYEVALGSDDVKRLMATSPKKRYLTILRGAKKGRPTLLDPEYVSKVTPVAGDPLSPEMRKLKVMDAGIDIPGADSWLPDWYRLVDREKFTLPIQRPTSLTVPNAQRD